MMGSKHVAILAIANEGKSYSHRAKGKKPQEHKQGPPAPHFFKALIHCLLTK